MKLNRFIIVQYTISAVWSPHFKFLVFKMESVQRFFTKRLQGMWRQGYDDRLRLLNTHSLEYRRLYSDLVLFPATIK